jgi:chaperonin cofactor prefoldin
MSIENYEVERIFSALQNLDRKQDDIREGLAHTSTLVSVNASKVEDATARLGKLEAALEKRVEATDRAMEMIWTELKEVKAIASETKIKGNLVWGILISAGTVGVELLLKFVFKI